MVTIINGVEIETTMPIRVDSGVVEVGMDPTLRSNVITVPSYLQDLFMYSGQGSKNLEYQNAILGNIR